MGNILDNGRKTIAVAVASITSSYHENIMRGAVETAELKGYNVIAFAAGPFNNPDRLAQAREKLFDLIDPELFDGIIIPVSSHTRYLNDEETQRFVDSFYPTPVINIGSVLKSAANIVVDYSNGLTKLMKHLVIDHGYKNIAFIRGPEHHASSVAREAIFRDLIKSYNIEHNSGLIVATDLRKSAAPSALDTLFSSTELDVEVIITCNDNLALGIMEELTSRGIKVPHDIAVIGSMNINLSSFSYPQLTTIKEPMYELGVKAVELLGDIFSGQKVPETEYVPTSLVIRQSCGIEEIKSISPRIRDEHIAQGINIPSLTRRLERVLIRYRCYNTIHILDEIITLLEIAFNKSDSGPLLDRLEEVFSEVVGSEDILGWISICSELKHILLDQILKESNTFLTSLIYQLEAVKEKFGEIAIKYKNYEMDVYINYFKDIILKINHSFDKDTVKSFSLQMINLEDFYVSIFNKDDSSSATNIIAVRYNYPDSYIDQRIDFRMKDIIPQHLPSYDDRYSLLVLPLSYRQVALGYLTVNMNKTYGSAYENMQVIISTALKNVLQIEELVDKEKQLLEYKEHLEELVKERTEELETSLSNLKKTQSLLIESEKMASLGSLVAGVAHELNTPLGISITSTSHLSSLTSEVRKGLEENSLSKIQLEEFLTIAENSSDITLRNLKKTASIISEFKQVAVDQVTEERREFDISEYLKNFLQTYYPQSKLGRYSLVFMNSIDKLVINSYPGVISPILTALISNSLRHGFISRVSGVITVELSTDEDSVIIKVYDDGIGIPKKNKSRIFDPFFTTARHRGDHGLGLNVVYNTIRKRLNGTITCESLEDGIEGSSFTITFPIT